MPSVDPQQPDDEPSRVTPIHERDSPTPDATLARQRRDLNRTTARRIAENERVELLPRIRSATNDAREAIRIIGMAQYGGLARDEDPLANALVT